MVLRLSHDMSLPGPGTSYDSVIEYAEGNTHLFLKDEAYNDRRTCKSCGRDYVDIDNVGRLACAYHPGVLDVVVDNRGVYQCCGGRRGSHGCLPCDHNDAEVGMRLRDLLAYNKALSLLMKDKLGRMDGRCKIKYRGKYYLLRAVPEE